MVKGITFYIGTRRRLPEYCEKASLFEKRASMTPKRVLSWWTVKQIHYIIDKCISDRPSLFMGIWCGFIRRILRCSIIQIKTVMNIMFLMSWYSYFSPNLINCIIQLLFISRKSYNINFWTFILNCRYVMFTDFAYLLFWNIIQRFQEVLARIGMWNITLVTYY